jgi:hypothetical protein
MTRRCAHGNAEPLGNAVDFAALNCAQASERVRQLVSAGLAESLVADLVGWDLSSVRRSCCAERGRSSWFATRTIELAG